VDEMFPVFSADERNKIKINDLGIFIQRQRREAAKWFWQSESWADRFKVSVVSVDRLRTAGAGLHLGSVIMAAMLAKGQSVRPSFSPVTIPVLFRNVYAISGSDEGLDRLEALASNGAWAKTTFFFRWPRPA